MYDILKKIGFSQSKSYDNTSQPFEYVPDCFKRYFILGFWDGDGYVSIAKDGRNLTGVVSNNKELLQSFVDYINKSIKENFCKVVNTDGYNRIRLSANKAKIFLDWLYTDLPYTYLERKYLVYSKMSLGTKEHTGFDNWLVKGILCIESNKIYVTTKDCCLSEFGIENPGAMNNIRACCRGERYSTRNKHFRYLTETEREDYINGKFNF